MSDEREEKIRRRAHELWVTEGKPEGREMDFWLQAERELSAAGTKDAGESGPPKD